MKRFGAIILGLLYGALATQPHIARGQAAAAEVLSFDAVVEPIVLSAAANAFVTIMVANAAIHVTEDVSEPLGNYEVDLRRWHGSYFQNNNGQEGRQWMWSYLYYPDSGNAVYTEIQRWWWIDDNGQLYDDKIVYHDAFEFSSDSCDVEHTYQQPDGTEFTVGLYGSVDEYYVKRNGSAWFGRPVRAHIVGYTWSPAWYGVDTTMGKQYLGPWGYDQWVFVPRNTYATFTVPWSTTPAFNAGYGYATTFYEIL